MHCLKESISNLWPYDLADKWQKWNDAVNPSAPECLLEQLVDPLVLVGPARRLDEAVVLDRVRRQLPVRLAQLDQLLREAHAVLEVHVRVDHAVADQEAALEAVREVNRRRLPVRLRVALR